MTTIARDSNSNPVPSLQSTEGPGVRVVSAANPPKDGAFAVPVARDGPVDPRLGLDRAALASAGFSGELGETLLIPSQGAATLVAVGIGKRGSVNPGALRDAAAAFARATGKHASITIALTDIPDVPVELAAQMVVEGVLLARYHYDSFKSPPEEAAVSELVLVASPNDEPAVTRGAERGGVFARVGKLARDLSNAPGSTLTATRMAEVATEIAGEHGLDIAVYDRDALIEMRCGGLLGVNAGSALPPRMIKLTYRPKRADGQTGHLSLVGKGIMYDSGGINLKPTDDMHLAMKMDMSGAAAVLATMSSLSDLGCQTTVTGYLMCTDNMPSGSAMKMGDVLTMRDGTTVEINNTDAEGRLVMADAIVMATEEGADAIVDIATLTGACLRALGDRIAGVMTNNASLLDQLQRAADRTAESIWELPLDQRYRKQLNSEIAMMRNVGEMAPAAITAGLFLETFAKSTPWAHLDIAGTMRATANDLWLSTGATGFGARLLAQLATTFFKPA
ncbi:MAG TPA: leucyl aminopeptidase [Candidatus Cybelea sp.]